MVRRARRARDARPGGRTRRGERRYRAQRHPARPAGAGRRMGEPGRHAARRTRRRSCTTASRRSGRNVTDAMLAPSADGTGYFKSAKLLSPDDPSLITDQTISADIRGTTVTARIRRDAYGVPHMYSDTDDGVIFGAGYVDRRGPQPAARPGARQRPRGRARHPGRAGHRAHPRPLRRTRRRRRSASASRASRSAALRKAGVDGLPGAARHRHLPRRHQPLVLARTGPTQRLFDRTDIYALNADQGAVPRRGRRRGDPERAVPRHGARRARQQGGHAGLPGPAHAQRPGDVDDDAAARAAPDERPGDEAEGPRPARGGLVPAVRRDAAGRRRVGRRGRRGRAPAPARRPTSCWSTGSAPRRARRSWSAARRSATTTPA